MMMYIIERFHLFLEDKRSTGIIIFDEAEDKRLINPLKEEFYDIIKGKIIIPDPKHIRKKDFSETIYSAILFAKDDYSNTIQACDLITSCTKNALVKLKKDISPEKILNQHIEYLYKYNQYLKIYWPFFHRSMDGRVNGWGIKINEITD